MRLKVIIQLMKTIFKMKFLILAISFILSGCAITPVGYSVAYPTPSIVIQPTFSYGHYSPYYYPRRPHYNRYR
jgi:uncharacterized lipoprotein YajG